MTMLLEKTKQNTIWPYILDHPFRTLIMGGSVSGKMNTWFNLLVTNLLIKFNLSIKDLNELKCQYHIRQYEKVGFDHYKEPN